MTLGPTVLSVYPPFNPAAFARRPAHSLPFPLDRPGYRLYLEARQGLWWGLQGLGIGRGSEVLTPAYHHGSEIEVLVRTGARCRFYDCRDGFEPDEAQLESLMTARVRALYLIHPLGFAQDSARWRRWCDERGLLLLEDGAQAWLSARDGRPVGSEADLALFCLHKVFGLPDGGAVWSRAFGGPLPDDAAVGLRGLAGRIADWTAQRSRVAAAMLMLYRGKPRREERPSVEFALNAVNEKATCATRVLARRIVDTDAPARRRAHFTRLAQSLGHLRPEAFAELPPESSPLAFPIEVDRKQEVLERLSLDGIAQSWMWMVPHPALDTPAHPAAAALRSRMVGLPVHQELRPGDLERIEQAALRAVR
jgi:dTDP-4-amino-4,6-dideoxygalactose transaminase